MTKKQRAYYYEFLAVQSLATEAHKLVSGLDTDDDKTDALTLLDHLAIRLQMLGIQFNRAISRQVEIKEDV